MRHLTNRYGLFFATALPVVALAVFASAQEPKPAAKPDAKAEAKLDPKLERGKYLVEEVGRCQECHSPTLPDGSFDRANWMKGATLVGIPATPI
ncbi:MAG: hypothetical protein JJE39_15440, partial [Vicinamibacteria bacterium]|nr:hypothetical protein [Vicinamibacteria bacterium]